MGQPMTVDQIPIQWHGAPFDAAPETLYAPALDEDGRPVTVERLIGELQKSRPGAAFVDVYIGDVSIPPAWRRLTRVKPGQTVQIIRAVKGDLFGKLAVVALTIAATAVAGPLGTAFAGYLGAGAFGTALITAGVTAGLSVVASLASRAFLPASSAKDRNLLDQSSANTITGLGNRKRMGGAIPDVIGTHRMYFDFAADPYTSTRANDQYVHALFMAGYGDVIVEDLKIGETPIENFDDVEVDIIRNTVDPVPESFGSTPSEPPVGVTLDRGVQNVRTSAADTVRLVVDLILPSGSFRIDRKGREHAWPVEILFEYRPASGGDWIPVPINNSDTPGVRRYIVKQKGLSRRAVSWKVARGQYDVRVTRQTSGPDDLTAEEQDTYDGDTIVSAVQWSTLRSFEVGRAIQFPKAVTVVQLVIRASDQLSGQLDRVNAIVSKVGRQWNGSEWVDGVPRNTAEAYMTALKSTAHDRLITDAEIDFPSIELFWERADEKGWRYNHIHDFPSAPFNAFKDILASGQARVDLSSGAWGVFFDEGAAAPIVHHFTADNVGEMRADRSDLDIPHAFRVRFRNADEGFEYDERTVYRDGYDEANATRVDLIEYQGLNYARDNFRRARYDFRQLLLQSWSRKFPVGKDFHVYKPGQHALVSHPSVIGAGGGWIRSISGDDIRLSRPLTLNEGTTYQIEFTSVASGERSRVSVLSPPGYHDTLTISYVPAGVVEGDFYIIGPQGRLGQEVVINEVAPNKSGGAMVTVHAANLAYLADEPVEPPDFVSNIPEGEPAHEAPPKDLEFRQYLTPTEFGVENTVELTFAPAGLIPAERFAGRWRRIDVLGDEWDRLQIGATPAVTLNNVADGVYEAQFRTQAVGRSDFSAWSEVITFTVDGRDAPPASLITARADLIDQTAIEITATAPSDVNRASFIIRYTPRIGDATKLDAETVAEGVTSFPVRVRARGGTYYLDAVSFAGNESLSSKIITVDPALIKTVDVVESIQGGPIWSGVFDRVVEENDLLRLEFTTPGDGSTPFEAEGFYAMGQIDLGAIVRADITAALDGFGLAKSDDVFLREDWFVDEFFGSTNPSEYSIKAEFRATNDDPGGAATWTDWEAFTGDIRRFRAIDFRLRFASFREDVTPVLRSVTLGVNPVEREVTGKDISAPSVGMRVTYPGSFHTILAGPLITTQDGTGGDRAPEITNRDLTGFDIQFFDGAGAAVSRTFDYVTKGLGGD